MSENHNSTEPVLRLEHVKKYFPVRQNGKKLQLKAVDDVSLDIYPGETVGLVGESGCGKSTLGRVALCLHEATAGRILFEGTDLAGLSDSKLRPYRRNMQIIFQDPYAALNPRRTIFEAVKAPLDAFHLGSEAERRKRVTEMLHFVEMGDYQFEKLPHELSGGQRQRVVIARAMILNPRFIVCDEPVSALDVSVRSSVLNLMKDAQEKTGAAYLFISHDMSVVRYLCDKVAVMYLGQLVEYGSKEAVFEHPYHPYTQALLSAIPIPDVDHKRNRIVLTGDVPSPLNPPDGCRFHNRCPYATEACASGTFAMQDMGDGHLVMCPFAGEINKRRRRAEGSKERT